jgi:hypothetical protein
MVTLAPDAGIVITSSFHTVGERGSDQVSFGAAG